MYFWWLCSKFCNNGKILSNTKFKNLYVSSSSGDSGGAIGSATYFLSQKNIFLNKEYGSYYGPKFNNDEIQNCIKKNKKIKRY